MAWMLGFGIEGAWTPKKRHANRHTQNTDPATGQTRHSGYNLRQDEVSGPAAESQPASLPASHAAMRLDLAIRTLKQSRLYCMGTHL